MRSGKAKSYDNVFGSVSRYIQVWRGRECVLGASRWVSDGAKVGITFLATGQRDTISFEVLFNRLSRDNN